MEGTVVTTGLEAITSAASQLPALATSVWNVLIANPLLCVFAALSLFGVGVAIFKKAKGVSRG